MTQETQPGRRNPHRCRRRVYGFECFDVDPGTGLIRIDPGTGAPRLRIDYVGQTRQRPSAREEQHRDEKPWADLIVRMVILAEGVWTQDELDAAENDMIRRVRPRYNYAGNLDNPERIEIWSPQRQQWRQMEQRWARDDTAGRPRWVPPADRAPDAAASRPIQPASSVYARCLDPRRWPRWMQKVTLWSLAWITATSVVWAGLARNGWLPAGRSRPLTAALVCAAVLAISLWIDRRRWRRVRRWLRRIAG